MFGRYRRPTNRRVALLGVLSWILSARSCDRAVVAITIAGTLTWAALSLAFSLLGGNAPDSRGFVHLVLALVLVSCLVIRLKVQGSSLAS